MIRALSSGALPGPTVLQIWGMGLFGSLTKTVNPSQINSPPVQISPEVSAVPEAPDVCLWTPVWWEEAQKTNRPDFQGRPHHSPDM